MPVLRARNLGKSFSGCRVFSGISLEVSAGLVAVTGANGSGKSTLLKILAGLTRPSRGTVEVEAGAPVARPTIVRNLVGWCSPEIEFLDQLTADENLFYLARAAGLAAKRERIIQLLESLNLRHWRGKRMDEFSAGMKQRVRLAFSLLADPPILLWDEPFSNLDAEGIAAAGVVVAEKRRHGPVVLATNNRSDLVSPEEEVALS